MLEYLHLKNVGPAPEMQMDLAPRLNLITGDNGLGKSFLLDVAWWVHTRTWPTTWPAHGAVPDRTPGSKPSISWRERRGARTVDVSAPFNSATQLWEPTHSSEDEGETPRLVVFARVDGGFSVWDPLRKGEPYRLPFGQPAWGTSSAFQFSATDVWEGLTLRTDPPRRVCEGMWRDWAMWQLAGNGAFDLLQRVVTELSADDPIGLSREHVPLVVDETRDSPLIDTPYGAVPLVHASAGTKRILSLAYILVWAFREHARAAQMQNVARAGELVFLIDEAEAHLHPRWQRHIVPALLSVGGALDSSLAVQLMVTTHAPLVLASLEPVFDPGKDAWFDLDLLRDEQRVTIEKRPFVRRGTAGRWLTSQAFDLPSEGRSLEAERAIAEAEALLERRGKGASPSREEVEAVDRALRAVLPDVDRFWIRWSGVVDELMEPA